MGLTSEAYMIVAEERYSGRRRCEYSDRAYKTFLHTAMRLD
jgi:hypothetical protein